MTAEREGLAEVLAKVIADHPRFGCGCCSWSEDCATCDSGELVAHDCPRDLDRSESIARSVADALADLLAARDRRVRAEAWDEGHRHRQRRGPDKCQCYAYSESECGCGLYGTGRLVSLDANPYRIEADDE